MSASAKKATAYTPKKVVLLIVSLFFMFIFGLVCPTWSEVTRTGVRVLGVFLGWIIMMISGFGLMIPSLLSMFALIPTGIISAGGVLANGFGNSVPLLFVFGMLLIYAFSNTGGDKVIVRYLISRKFLNGHPVRFTLVFLLAITVLSVFMDTGALFLGFAFVKAIADVVGYDEEHEWRRFMLTAVFFLCMCAANVLPSKGGSLLTIGAFNGALAEAGIPLDIACFSITNLVTSLIFAVVLALTAKPLFRTNMDKMKSLNVEDLIAEGESTKLNKRQIISGILMLIGFLFPVIQMFFPAESAIYVLMSNIGQVVFMAFLLALLNLINVDGEPICNVVEAFSKGVLWDVYLAIASVCLLSSCMTNADSGISAWLTAVFGHAFNNMSFPVMLALILVCSGIITQFFSNGATMVIVSTIIAQFAVAFSAKGINVAVFPALLAQTCQMGYLTVAGSGFTAILLGYPAMKAKPGWIFTKGTLMYVLYFIIAIPFGILFGYVL